MGIAFRAAEAATPTSGDTVFTIPATVQAGDLIIVAGGINNGGDTSLEWPTPAGWTRVDGHDTNFFSALYLRRATAGDAGSQVTFATTALAKSGSVLIAYSGVDPVTPLDDWDFRLETTSTAAHATPVASTSIPDDLIIIIGVQANSSVESWQTTAGYTKRQDAIYNDLPSGHVTVTVQDKPAATLGDYGGENLVAADNALKAITWTLALAPATDTQVARPTSDVASTNATAVPALGAGEGLYSRLAGTDDAHYDQVDTGGHVEVGFAALTDPNASDNHTLTYRAQAAGGATGGTMTVTVKDGGTTIATWSDTLTGAMQAFSHTLSTAEADAITDYAALTVDFAPSVS